MTQSFDEWNYPTASPKAAWDAGQQSRQAEVDALDALSEMSEQKIDDLVLHNIELQKRISVYEKHTAVLKTIHENEFDENSDTSYIPGNLDGFFECLNEDLKGNQDEK